MSITITFPQEMYTEQFTTCFVWFRNASLTALHQSVVLQSTKCYFHRSFIYHFKIYHHPEFPDPSLGGANVGTTSEFGTASSLELFMAGNLKIQ